jgi:hypothetical protein
VATGLNIIFSAQRAEATYEVPEAKRFNEQPPSML